VIGCIRPGQLCDQVVEITEVASVRLAGNTMTSLGHSSKLNAEWEFPTMLHDERRRSADTVLRAHGDDLGRCSSLNLDSLLEGA